MNQKLSIVKSSLTPEERLKEAEQLDNEIVRDVFNVVYKLKRINDEQLFLELGYSDMKAYLQKRLNYNAQSVYMYLEILDKLGNYLPMPGNLNHDLNSRNPENLPFFKLYQLTRLPQKQIERLFEYNEIFINGSSLTMEKIREIDRSELAAIISYEKKAVKLNMPKPWIERRFKIRQTALKLIKMVNKEIDNAYIQGPEKEQIERPLKEIEIWLGNYFESHSKPE